MFRLYFIVAFIVVGVCGQDTPTTQPPHVHHERPETDSFSFFYDGATQAMLVTTADHNCYIWSLTSDEKSSIHSDNGLRAVELLRVI